MFVLLFCTVRLCYTQPPHEILHLKWHVLLLFFRFTADLHFDYCGTQSGTQPVSHLTE